MVSVPMRVVIGGMVALTVLIVAATTLVITYSVALSSLREVAEELSVSLVNVATRKAENFFEEPTRHLRLMQRFSMQPGIKYPSDEDYDTWHVKYFQMLLSFVLYSNNTYGNIGFIWEDGSAAYVSNFNPPQNTEVYLWATNVRDAAQNGGIARDYFEHRNLVDMTSIPIGHNDTGTDPRGDGRFAAYYSAQTLFPGRQGFFYPMVGWKPGADKLWLMFPAAIHLFNASGLQIGSASIGRDVRTLSVFLNEIASTGMEAFALDKQQFVIGSTHSSEYYTETCTTSTLAPPGCLNAAVTTIRNIPCYSMACFKKASDIPYIPLAAAAQQFPAMLSIATQAVALFKADGENYYIVSSNVPNPFRNFKINLVLIMDEERIIGDIESGRNLAIGCTTGIFLVATLVSFLSVMCLLRPLHAVSQRMKDTARLADSADGEDVTEFSSLTEVRNLQKSYYNMNAAIQSFTRYVPKDVVTDLMSSGQLCEIKMQDMRCSILFIDIRGFTTICERVPADALSALVTLYFDVMSKIVMKHDGLIDKYIGDCIMAVWGAPFPCPNHEIKSTLCALLLHRETMVEPLAGAFDEAGEVLGVRVGVNTGNVLAGNMGSAARMNYTVIGDPVNLAARLESMNKQFGTQVMISEDTAERCGTLFVLRLLMSIAVVGKAVPVKVYQVVAVSSDLCEADREVIKNNEDTINAHLDTMSESSDADSVTSHIAHQARMRNTSALGMLIEALSLSNPPVASETDIKFVFYFNEAVTSYLQEKFQKCIDILNHASSKEESELRNNSEKSIAVLRGLAEDAKKDPSVFCGYYAAAEK